MEMLISHYCNSFLKDKSIKHTSSDQFGEDIPSSKCNSNDKLISLDNDTKSLNNISSRCGNDPSSGRSHKRKVMPQKPIAEKRFLSTDCDNVDRCD